MQDVIFTSQPNVITYMDITIYKGRYPISIILQGVHFFKEHPQGVIVYRKPDHSSTIEALNFGTAKAMTKKQFFEFRCRALFAKINSYLPYKNRENKMPKKWLSEDFYLDCLRLQDKLENRNVIHHYDFNFCRKYIKKLKHRITYSND